MAKILQVCNSDFYLNKFLSPLVKFLNSQGHQVDCICDGTQVEKNLLGSNVAVYDFRFPRRKSGIEFLRGIFKMQKILREKKYDCVNSHNRNASIITRIAAWLENVPINLYTAHGFYFHDDQSYLAKSLTVFLEFALAHLTDFTLSQSFEDVEFVVQKGIVNRNLIEHIGNGIDTRRFIPKADRLSLEQKFSFKTNVFRICTVGRLVKGKGFIDLLEAFAEFHSKVKDSELLVVGGNIPQDISPFQKEFIDRVNSLGLQQKVTLTGITDRVEDYLAISDIFVLPSYREGVPRSLLEAMSVGLPSLATNIRGCREIISDGQNGFLFEPKDVNALSRLLFKLYENLEIRSDIAKHARKTVELKYDELDYVRKQAEVINRLLALKSIG